MKQYMITIWQTNGHKKILQNLSKQIIFNTHKYVYIYYCSNHIIIHYFILNKYFYQ